VRRYPICPATVSGLFVFVLLAAASVSAQRLDPAFSPILQDFGSSANGFASSRTTVVQPDGKILVGGKFTVAGGKARSKIARFNADYTLDPSFDAVVLQADEYSTLSSIEVIRLQADGKILIGGNFRFQDDPVGRTVARLNPDGSLDPSFQSPIVNAVVGDIEFQPDGKLIVGGTFQLTATNPANGQQVTVRNLARLNQDGSLDFSFVANAAEYSDNVVIQPDGKILVGNSQFSPSIGVALRRYNTNGSLDVTLAAIDGFGIKEVVLLADGKIFIAGDFNAVNGTFRARVAKLNSEGSIDNSFEIVNSLNGTVYDIQVEPDGKVLVVGDFYFFDQVVTQYNAVRLNANGTRDTTFNIDRRISGIPVDVNTSADGKYLFAGAFPVVTDIVNFNTFYENIARVNRNGTMEAGGLPFSVTEQGGVFDLQQQADGKIVLGGEFQYAEGVSRRFLSRYNADGSFDAAFDPNRDLSIVKDLDIQSTGKIIVATGGASVIVSRVNTNGSIDPTFTHPFVPFSASIQARTIVEKVLVLPDDKILVGGYLITGSATSPTRSGAVKLNPDGSRDTTFPLVGAVGGLRNVYDIAVQADGKIIIVGDFTTLNGTSRNTIARLNANGTIDESFNPPVPPGVIYEVEIQADGKIVYAGAFGAIVRVLPNGTPDGFNLAHDLTVETLKIQQNGKILIGGSFTTVGGVTRRRLARIEQNGTVDTSFNVAVNQNVYSVNLENDGDILLGGQFTRVNGQSRIAAARLLQTAGTAFDFDGDGKADPSIFRGSAGEWWLARGTAGTVAYQFGAAGDRVASADFTGDGKADAAFWRESTGQWFVLRSEDLTYYAFPFGTSGDIPVHADYDGDGKADAAVFRPSNSTWYIQNSAGGITIRAFGQSGDRPVAADYDGDGRADIAIYRPAAGEWWINRSSNGSTYALQFGVSSDRAVPADYTGDGKADLALYRGGEWLILRSENLSYYSFPFGVSSDTVVPADYDGDGRADAAVFRGGAWHIQRSTAGYTVFQFGQAGDTPVPGR
jgi:uncharacterized delta-60 repeat protein